MGFRHKSFIIFAFVIIFCQSVFGNDKKIDFPDFFMSNTEYIIPVNYNVNNITCTLQTIDTLVVIPITNHTISLKINRPTTCIFTQNNSVIYKQVINPIPRWISIIPPLLAIILALIFKEVLSAIFIGIAAGSILLHGIGYGLGQIWAGFLSVIDNYILNALLDTEHMSIILFSLLIGAVVQVITSNGGMSGLVRIISRKAKNKRSTQLTTWLLGISIFFDDYSNTLVVGNTMQHISNKMRISKAKLSYIVDSTAAPIASIAFITTWIGAELSYIKNGINIINIDANPYHVFFNSLSYSFYPVLALVFVFLIIWYNRDFGPMYKYELQELQRTENDIINININEANSENAKKTDFIFAIVPIGVIIFGAIVGLLYTGRGAAQENVGLIKNISLIIGNADTFNALLWSSLLALLTAVAMSLLKKISLKDTVEATVEGFKTMFTPICILVLAWALANITADMHTADFITAAFLSGNFPYYLLPAITFVLASVTAFSTGSSWGTMAILYPIMIPAAWHIALDQNLSQPDSMSVLYNVISCVLSGAVLGDHCSPISDTTILSSLATKCNHIVHVKTQMPYALVVGFVSLFFGTLLSALLIHPFISFIISILILIFIIKFKGKKYPEFN